jgi:hypothetical protein
MLDRGEAGRRQRHPATILRGKKESYPQARFANHPTSKVNNQLIRLTQVKLQRLYFFHFVISFKLDRLASSAS